MPTADVKPSSYHSQGDFLGYCGGYAIHAVLDAYGLADGRKPGLYAPVLQQLDGANIIDR